MADDPPTQARLSVSNHNKSRGKQATVSSRRNIVTIPRTLSSLAPLPSSTHLSAPQLGQKTSPPRLQTLIIMNVNPHLQVARMRVVPTCRKTPRQDQAANTAGSRSPVAVQSYHRRTCSVQNLLLLLLADWRGGLPSVLGFPTGRIVVHHLARRVPNGDGRAH
jgi:hypothetical protein